MDVRPRSTDLFEILTPEALPEPITGLDTIITVESCGLVDIPIALPITRSGN